jgi:hypothetical protein
MTYQLHITTLSPAQRKADNACSLRGEFQHNLVRRSMV